jgi:glutaredoxin 3
MKDHRNRSLDGMRQLWAALTGNPALSQPLAPTLPVPAAAVVVYTTGYCGYCHAAKRLLSSKGVAYEEIAADQRPDLRKWLRQVSRQHTVPQIFINGESIGGYTELRGLEGRGLLDERLATPPSPGDPPLRS